MKISPGAENLFSIKTPFIRKKTAILEFAEFPLFQDGNIPFTVKGSIIIKRGAGHECHSRNLLGLKNILLSFIGK